MQKAYSPNSTTVSPPVSKIIVNENFTKAEKIQKKLNKFYDLALLELSEDVDLSTFTPACLARASDLTTFDNKMALATGKSPTPTHSSLYVSFIFILGWGETEDGGQSDALLKVMLKVVPSKLYQKLNVTPSEKFDETVIRTHNFEFGDSWEDYRGVGSGDSGGPLTYWNNGQHTLIGVSSMKGE